MRFSVSLLAPALALALLSTGCDGCQSKQPALSEAERAQVLASAIAAPAASSAPNANSSIGHAANVLPGQGPKRIVYEGGRVGALQPILPGQGIGPIRIGASKETIERLMGAPCDDATESLCRYVGRAVDFKLESGVTKEIRISRKGREAKRAPDGSIIEYGFFNGAFLPDYYFGMTPQAMQEVVGKPERVEQISPMGPDGLSERHYHDGVVLEYDRWSNGKLVLGAATLFKSDTAAARNAKIMDDMQKRAAEAAAAGKKVPTISRPR
ncbi:MAG: hypothetical protein EOO73_13045 [Myxococcales bacterium]|nr:MAG: hypothetical protein EOO73_13045 [Myxococcales bacterium]